MVVAIIGILAAVGVVAYQGYTQSAAMAAAKSNQASIFKYIQAEIMKCRMGAIRIFDNRVHCNSIQAQHLGGLVHVIDDFKNPYDPNKLAFKSGGAAYEDQELGYTILNTQGNENFTIDTCFALPCSAKTNNRYSNILSASGNVDDK